MDYLPVGSVSNGKYMRWHFQSFLALVQLNDFLSVDWKPGIGIHNHAEQSGVSLEYLKEGDENMD